MGRIVTVLASALMLGAVVAGCDGDDQSDRCDSCDVNTIGAAYGRCFDDCTDRCSGMTLDECNQACNDDCDGCGHALGCTYNPTTDEARCAPHDENFRCE